MRLSQLFTKTRKEVSTDETSKNAQLLIKSGFIYKEMAGVYAFLPLGLIVIEKIKAIVREEMDNLGASELSMTTIQSKDLWQKTDRWDDKNVDVWFKSELKNGSEIGFGWSHEEPITNMLRSYISSYRDLPVYVYQFQNKLRNELRAKSGIMRGREFLMKDMYSFSSDEDKHKSFYDNTITAYNKVFDRVGIGKDTFLTFASGGAFTQFSHEFQTLTDSGEDVIYLHRQKKIAVNKEVLTSEVLDQLGLKREELEELKAAEVGNIFSFGSIKTDQLGLSYVDVDGKTRPVILGSYGIGISRLMGVIVELFSDEKGIVWPENIAPAKVYLARIGENNEVITSADMFYKVLTDKNIEVIYDDRDIRAGEKFADADLIGIPYRVVISDKTLKSGLIEVKRRKEKESTNMSEKEFIKKLAT